MAGSLGHLSGVDGGWSLIENMGDACECVEQLLWLVLRAVGQAEAERLLDSEFYPMKRREQAPDAALIETERRMDN
jgi:hypothetical protein